MTIKLNESSLRRMFPHGRQDYIDAFVKGAPELEKAGMLDEKVWPCVLGNVGAETGGCTIVSENMSYSARRMREVWPSRFRGPQGILKSKRLARNPRLLANTVYGARLGNRGRNTDDGYNFRGVGPLQLTGRKQAQWMQEKTGIAFADDPDQLRNPDNWITMLILTWTEYHGNLNEWALKGNYRACCNGINRGNPRSRYNPIGWSHRKRYYRKALEIFDSSNIQKTNNAILRDGDEGPEVRAMQKRLVDLGYHLGRADSDFGDMTELSLIFFQKTNGLTPDGIYGPLTREKLWSEDALKRPVSETRAKATIPELRKAGSTTIQTGDAVQTTGAVLATGTVAKTAIEEGGSALENLSAIAEKATLFETSSKALSGAFSWGASNLTVVAVIGLGVAFWSFGGMTKLRRLKAYIQGRDIGNR